MSHDQLIRKHLVTLKTKISDPDSLIVACYSEEVISIAEYEDLIKSTSSLKIANLLIKVQSKGEDKYKKFLVCLLETEHKEAHALLTSVVTTTPLTSTSGPRACQVNAKGQPAVKSSKIATLVSKDRIVADKLEQFADLLDYPAADKVPLFKGINNQTTSVYSACLTIIQSWVGRSGVDAATVERFTAEIRGESEFKTAIDQILEDYPVETKTIIEY